MGGDPSISGKRDGFEQHMDSEESHPVPMASTLWQGSTACPSLSCPHRSRVASGAGKELAQRVPATAAPREAGSTPHPP